jgi:UDP-glucuronate 4-epimerase
MKILLTGTAGFIGFHLAKKLLERGDEVVGLDNINDYYDVNLKYARLKELGIEREDISSNLKIASKRYINHSFYWTDLADTETIYKIFENERFDLVVNLAAQAGVRYSLKNPHVYIKSNVVGFKYS